MTKHDARLNTIETLLRKYVAITESCWIWTGSVGSNGYGQAAWQRKNRRAHRVFYECFKGPIPEGLVLDHLCRVKRCVNPDHLEAVTQRVNVLRSGPESTANRNAAKVVCIRGHEFNEKNTRYRKAGGRDCRACIRERRAAKRALGGKRGLG